MEIIKMDIVEILEKVRQKHRQERLNLLNKMTKEELIAEVFRLDELTEDLDYED